MSEKRKDSKGRILRTGESQRKDGKYEYKYVDVKGVRRSVYSWKLVDTDKVPAGKLCKESLRDIEKRLEEDIAAGVDTHLSGNITFEVKVDEPNVVTYAAMEAAEKGEDMYGPFDSVADLMEAPNA